MSSQRYTSKAMPAFKLMAAENEYHRRNEMLTKEIRKLRGEVGVMARRFLQARKEINQLIAKIKLQPPPLIPVRNEEEKKNEEEVVEKEDTKMGGMESKEKERQEPQTVRIPKPRKPISPSIPPPPPPPSPEHKTNLEKAWKYVGEKRKENTTVSQLNTVARTADKTPPAILPEDTKTEIEKASERALRRHDVWDRAVRGLIKEKEWRNRTSYEEYVEIKPDQLHADIGQWSIENYGKELTMFDHWAWVCVKYTGEENRESIGEKWLRLSKERVKKGTVNKIYRK